MDLNDLSANQLAEIDSISLAFEKQLRSRQLSDLHDGRIDGFINELVDQFVATYNGVHKEVLIRELRAVAAEVTAGSNSPTIAIGADSTKVPRRGAASLQPGTEIGPYEIDHLIGRGGMGEVYRGRDLRLGRNVAIKVLTQDWSDQPDHLDRFDREARAIAHLSHPNIVALFDVGRHGGRPFAVMELLQGQTLRGLLNSSSLMEPAEVRRIGAAIAEALAVAHRAGVVHRDLKPENLFVNEDNQIKLLDFGLSRITNDPTLSSNPTATGVIMGTMGYLAPEQAAGREVTPAADIFSLGCVLHECFYGQRAFGGETMAERIAVTMTAEPAVDDSRASVDRELAELIQRCLKKSPGERIGDAKEVARILSGQKSLGSSKISGPPIAGVAPGLNRRAWFQTAGSTVAVAAGVAAGVGGVYGGFQWLSRPASIRSIAVMPLVDEGPPGGTIPAMQTRVLGHGEQLAAAIADQLTRIPGLRIVPYLPLRAAEVDKQVEPLQTAVSRAQQLGVDAVLVGSVSVDGQGFETIEVKLLESQQGSQVLTYKVRVRTEKNLIGQQETASKVAEGLGRKLNEYQAGQVPSNMSYHCLVNGNSRMDPESLGSLRDAIECFKKAIDQDQKFGEAYAGLSLAAMLLVGQVKQVERLELVEVARQACSDALELDQTLGPARLAKAMLTWQVDWNFDAADQIFSDNISRMPDNWVAQHEYAYFLAARGDLGALANTLTEPSGSTQPR